MNQLMGILSGSTLDVLMGKLVSETSVWQISYNWFMLGFKPMKPYNSRITPSASLNCFTPSLHPRFAAGRINI